MLRVNPLGLLRHVDGPFLFLGNVHQMIQKMHIISYSHENIFLDAIKNNQIAHFYSTEKIKGLLGMSEKHHSSTIFGNNSN